MRDCADGGETTPFGAAEMYPSARRPDTTRIVNGFITEKPVSPGGLREWYRSTSLSTSLTMAMAGSRLLADQHQVRCHKN